MEFNILGNSSVTLSFIYENLFSQNGFDFKINIIKNLVEEDKQNLSFHITESGQLYDDLEHKIATSIYFHSAFNFTHNKSKYILGASKVKSKKQIVKFFESMYNIYHDSYINLIPKNVNLSKMIKFGNGIMLNYGTTLAPYVEIGNFVTINRNVSIGHHTKICDYVTINPGVNIAGSCYIGHSVTIGIGAIIIDNIRIGNNVVIGAGSLVLKNVEDNVVVFGSPAKIIKYINIDE
jgi:sugar O-acyltransferase (sialic acid O-acetyltransferase NeuD family)